MMIGKKMQDALNGQVNAELASWYLYKSMSFWFQGENLPGMAHWMKLQADEEMGHAMKIAEFINDRGGQVVLDGLAAPRAKWNDPLDAFEAAYKHEQSITARIDALVELACKEGDKAAGVFLQWFVTEQVEEEASADQVVRTLRMIGEGKNGLLVLDHHLGKRGAD